MTSINHSSFHKDKQLVDSELCSAIKLGISSRTLALDPNSELLSVNPIASIKLKLDFDWKNGTPTFTASRIHGDNKMSVGF